MSTYQKLVDRYFPHDEETAEFEGGVPEATIAAAEAKLGVRFPPPLRAFLGELGSGHAGSEEFIWPWRAAVPGHRARDARLQGAFRRRSGQAPAAPPRRLRQPRLPRREHRRRGRVGPRGALRGASRPRTGLQRVVRVDPGARDRRLGLTVPRNACICPYATSRLLRFGSPANSEITVSRCCCSSIRRSHRASARC